MLFMRTTITLEPELSASAPDPQAVAPHPGWSIRGLQALFVFGVLGALLTWVLEGSGTTFSPVDRREIWKLHAGMSGVLLGLAMLIRPGRWRAAGFAAVFGAGAWTISIVPAAGQLAEGGWMPWAAAALGMYAVHTACRAIEAHRRARWMLCPLGAVGMAAILAGSWTAPAGGANAAAAPDLGEILGPELRPLTFTRTPNLYVLSFEAFTDARVLHEHFGTPREGTALHATLRARARPVGALYANGVSTITSFNAIASLGEEAFHRALEAVPWNRLVLFAGSRRSPLFELLRSNGYSVTTGYPTAYFAVEDRPGVDAHFAMWERAACRLMRFEGYKRAFWGYCATDENIDPAAGDWAERSARVGMIRRTENAQNEKMMELIRTVRPGARQFTWIHFSLPGHIRKGYWHPNPDHREQFKTWYEERSETANRWLRGLLDHVERNDPDGIVLIFGDHGVLASWGTPEERERTFELRDKFSVAGGIFPPEACREEIDEAQAPGWLTHLDLVHAVLRCLSGGETARQVRKKLRPHIYFYDAKFTWHHHLPDARYEEFVRPWSDRSGWRGR